MATITTRGRSAAKDVERAAQELLRERIALVGEAALARDERDQAAETLRSAETGYAERYMACRQAGWTVQELRRLGLTSPTDGGRQAGRRAGGRVDQTGDQTGDDEDGHPAV